MSVNREEGLQQSAGRGMNTQIQSRGQRERGKERGPLVPMLGRDVTSQRLRSPVPKVSLPLSTAESPVIPAVLLSLSGP